MSDPKKMTEMERLNAAQRARYAEEAKKHKPVQFTESGRNVGGRFGMTGRSRGRMR